MSDQKIWIVGAGLMSIDYAKVLEDLSVDYLVIGRGEVSAQAFREETGAEVITGGLEEFLKSSPAIPSKAIVTVDIASLSDTTNRLLECGIREILLEKPGVGYPQEIVDLVANARSNKANVLLAYNRRFYASVIRAKEIIREDGGVTSFNFEFTEWAHLIGPMKKTKAEHNNWFIGNSSHIIDTAFYLGGKPKEISSFHTGQNELDWHPASSIYAGAGVTESGALFSYHANWIGPGRWVIEMLTRKHRLIFKPIEQLQIQEIGSVAVNPAEGVDYSIDEKFKPGLHKQTSAFLEGEYGEFCDVFEQQNALDYYKKMSNY